MKKLLGIVVLSLLWCSNSFSQNCDPNHYNDGMMVKEYEAEWNYKAEEAYSFGTVSYTHLTLPTICSV